MYPSLDADQTWMEVAYGTRGGGVRVIVRHPENIGHAPQLFQTYNVHSSSVSKVVLSEKYLVSGNNACIHACTVTEDIGVDTKGHLMHFRLLHVLRLSK